MKNYALLSLVILFAGFTHAQQTPPTKYFEGVVEYQIENKSYMKGVSDNEVRERNGDSLRVYFKNGNYMREYIDGGGYILRKMYYLLDKNMMYDYNLIDSPDTVYLIDPTDSLYLSYKIEPGNAEKILNRVCSSSVISAKYYFPLIQDTGNVTMTYFFAQDLPVNPEWFKAMYIWKDVINKHKSIAIKFIEDDPYFFKQTFTATRIMAQSVDDEMFKIDPRLVQKKMLKQ
jgi:hypothetical protein